MSGSPSWIGVDLDGTLAEHKTGELEIGKPVPLMLGRVLAWIKEGQEVRIVTARVNSENNPLADKQRAKIDTWCKKYLGQTVPVTCKKSHSMIELWDDRAIQVIPNTGERVLQLEGRLLASDPESLHCEQHSFFSTGCGACYTTALFSSYVREEKLQKVAPTVNIHPLEIHISKPSPMVQLIRSQMERKIFIFLQNAASDSAVALRKQFIQKADNKEKERDEELFLLAWSAVKWNELVDDIYSDLYQIAKLSAQEGVTQLAVAEAEEDVETLAEKYAKIRTSDIIGEGTRYSVADTTKEDIKSVIEEGLSNKESEVEIANDLKASTIFSRNRAKLIAETETSMAQAFNHLAIWKRSGKVKSVNIELSADHVVTDSCDDLVSGNPYLIEKVPEIPAHPNCKCSIVVNELN